MRDSFSRTPCSRHMGHEFRPVTSHCRDWLATTTSMEGNGYAWKLDEETYLVDAFTVIEVTAFGELPHILLGFKITQTNETAGTGADSHVYLVAIIDRLAFKRTGDIAQPACSAGRSNLLLSGHRWFDRSQQGGEQLHVFIRWIVREQCGHGESRMVGWYVGADHVDEPTATPGMLGCIVGFHNTVATARARPQLRSSTRVRVAPASVTGRIGRRSICRRFVRHRQWWDS